MSIYWIQLSCDLKNYAVRNVTKRFCTFERFIERNITHPTGMTTQRSYFGRKSHSHPRLVKTGTTKESVKTKTESENCFCILVV